MISISLIYYSSSIYINKIEWKGKKKDNRLKGKKRGGENKIY